MSTLKKLSKKTVDVLAEQHLISKSNAEDAQKLATGGHVQGLTVTQSGASVTVGVWVFSKRTMKNWYRASATVDGDGVSTFSCACVTKCVHA